jgi:putative DNA primase/helicase
MLHGRLRLQVDDLTTAAKEFDELWLPLTYLYNALVGSSLTRWAALFYLYRFLKCSRFDEHVTDLGNARRLVALHGHDLLHCPELGWLAWNGRRWDRDQTGEVQRRAKTIPKSWADDARIVHATARFETDEIERKRIVRRTAHVQGWARSCESAKTLKAMEGVAVSEPTMHVSVDVLDADPWLLNAQNGTIDLRTGKLNPHRREDLLTHICSASYDPDARSQLWAGFLDQLTGEDQELQKALQRAAGYSLIGSNPERVVFLAVGRGGSGKSTFVEALKNTLGDYARTANFDAFLKKRSGGGPSPELARLRGARVVISIEVDEGQEFAHAAVKSLSGGDTITVRHLYKDFFEFLPTFTLMLVANDPPIVDPDDDAMWSRIRVLPLDNPLPQAERDPRVRDALINVPISGSAILTWLVQGTLMYLDEGLGDSVAVAAATAAYRTSMDHFGDFLKEHCELGRDKVVGSTPLLARYDSWAQLNGEPRLTSKALGKILRKKGFSNCKVDGGDARGWRGLGLKPLSDWALAALPETRALPPGRT